MGPRLEVKLGDRRVLTCVVDPGARGRRDSVDSNLHGPPKRAADPEAVPPGGRNHDLVLDDT
jgi:hypothetical protein